MSYNRYSNFLKNGTYTTVPSVTITKKATDYTEIYDHNKTRLDILSYKYYGDAGYDWLIMMANPEYGSLEFEIPDGSVLRIPYPLNTTLDLYNKAIQQYNTLYK